MNNKPIEKPVGFTEEKTSAISGPQLCNYEDYRKSYPAQICRSRTSQSGKIHLEPALELRGTGEAIAPDNRELRRRICAAWRDLLGSSSRNTGPLKARVLEEQEFSNYVRRKVEYEADPDEPVRAWLFIPKNLKSEKCAALLCLHQTVREGKDQTAGLDAQTPELAFGPLLAERGYVTLCPDVICFGERYLPGGSFYCHYGDALRIQDGNNGRSILSKMADDAMRAVDYFCSLPQVDSTRIGSIGHSHGGYGTLFAMAFDERIKVSVVSCGFTCFRSDSTPERWYRKTAMMPRLGSFEGKIEETPVDFHHLFAALAPRGLFLSVALRDSIYPNIGDVQWIEQDVQKVYGREHNEAFVMHAFDGAHSFPDETRDLAWEFLDKYLKSD